MKKALINIAVACCFTCCSEVDHASEPPLLKSASANTAKKNKKEAPTDVTIMQKWDLPEELKEVSGISYLANDRFACIQDELGSIFIFNSGSGQIEKTIPFAGAGDYEGIAVNGTMAFIIRADGHLFELNMDAGRGSLREYDTHLSMEQNVEGLSYDAQNNRLLLAIKG